MTNAIFNPGNVTILGCPNCGHDIRSSADGKSFICDDVSCKTVFPVYHDIPCILNEEMSVFSNADFATQKDTFFKLSESSAKKAVKKMLPVLSLNVSAKLNYRNFAKVLLDGTDGKERKKVLVLGGSIIGQGMSELLSNYPTIDFIETDVSFGPRTMVICDGHNLPFKDNSFDGVIVQAVLEHVVDPYRCVHEIYRVLKDDGIVYAETPFMQQVHGRQYDFTRFSHLGHRRLFRNFGQITSGAVCGPGMALAWSYKYFLLSFSSNGMLRKLISVFARVTSFHLKYFDYLLINKKGTLDAASGYFFLGRKSREVLSDKELLQSYAGAF